MLCYESSPGVRTEAGAGAPWGWDRVGVHKNAIQSVRLHPAPGSHPRKRGPCSTVRGRTWFRFVPCLRPISPVFQPTLEYQRQHLTRQFGAQHLSHELMGQGTSNAQHRSTQPILRQ